MWCYFRFSHGPFLCWNKANDLAQVPNLFSLSLVMVVVVGFVRFLMYDRITTYAEIGREVKKPSSQTLALSCGWRMSISGTLSSGEGWAVRHLSSESLTQGAAHDAHVPLSASPNVCLLLPEVKRSRNRSWPTSFHPNSISCHLYLWSLLIGLIRKSKRPLLSHITTFYFNYFGGRRGAGSCLIDCLAGLSFWGILSFQTKCVIFNSMRHFSLLNELSLFDHQCSGRYRSLGCSLHLWPDTRMRMCLLVLFGAHTWYEVI